MNFATRPLAGRLGLEIQGLDLRNAAGPDLAAALAPLLYQHAVLCLRGQNLTPAELAHFGELFGQPVHHNEVSLRLDGLPAVMSLSNADLRDDRQLNGGAHWHTDLVHSDEPASVTMLNAVAVPAEGGGTMFADQKAAFEALPAERQALAESITVVHCYEGRTDGSMPTFHHPLVRRHPVTGHRALYGAADTGIGILGMPDDRARRLLAEFAGHATEARFVYLHSYQPHDIVMWDNARLLHCAQRLERATVPATRRIMHRVSVRGWLPATVAPMAVAHA